LPFPSLTAIEFASTEEWWLQVRKRVPKALRRDFDDVVILRPSVVPMRRFLSRLERSYVSGRLLAAAGS
jgi:hypothetical protein